MNIWIQNQKKRKYLDSCFRIIKLPSKWITDLNKKIWIKASNVAEEENIDNLELGSDSRMQHQNHQRRNLINWIPSKWETCSKDTAKGIKRRVWGREAETRRAVSPPSFPPILSSHLSSTPLPPSSTPPFWQGQASYGSQQSLTHWVEAEPSSSPSPRLDEATQQEHFNYTLRKQTIK